MNKTKRKIIENQINKINECINELRDTRDGERFRMSSIPYNFQNTERYEKMEDAVESINSALSCLKESIDHLDNAMT